MHIVHLTVPVVFVFSTMVNAEHSGSECIFEEMPERTVYAPKLHFVVTIEDNNMRIELDREGMLCQYKHMVKENKIEDETNLHKHRD